METHDMTRPYWGHRVEITEAIDDGQRLRAAIWSTPLPADGDCLLLPNGNDTTRYRVVKIDRCYDPPDMAFLDLVFAPRI